MEYVRLKCYEELEKLSKIDDWIEDTLTQEGVLSVGSKNDVTRLPFNIYVPVVFKFLEEITIKYNNKELVFWKNELDFKKDIHNKEFNKTLDEEIK